MNANQLKSIVVDEVASDRMPYGPRGLSAAEAESQVIIVGAGPVGLVLAGLLARQGRRSLVLEKRSCGPDKSMAIGVMPVTLAILDELGVGPAFVRDGLKIVEAEIYGAQSRLGTVCFNRLEGAHPYILSIPQARMVQLLEEHVLRMPEVTVMRGIEVVRVHQESDRVWVDVQAVDGKMPYGRWIVFGGM